MLGLNKTVEYFHGHPKRGKIQRVEKPDPADELLRMDAVSLFHSVFRPDADGLLG